MLGAAAPAYGYASLSNPPDGATAMVDKADRPFFAWTLPPDEFRPQVETAPSSQAGSPPSFDPDTLDPFGSPCLITGQSLTSCRSDGPFAAGAYTAFMWTQKQDPNDPDQNDNVFSPFTTFVVRPFLVWGNNDPADPTAPVIKAAGIDGLGHRYSAVQVIGWLNVPGSEINYSFTIKRRRRVLKRKHEVRHVASDANGGEAEEATLNLHPFHGVREFSPLKCTVVMRGGGITLKRTFKIKAP